MPGAACVRGILLALSWAGCAGAPAPRVAGAESGCRLEPVTPPVVADAAGLRDPRVEAMLTRADGSLVVAYRPRLGLGISLRDAAGGWTHLAPATAPMRSGRVRDLVVDAAGAIWLVYADGTAGVSRLSGTVLETFTPENSALPIADVDRVFCEPANEGPAGDGVWCVTTDGLTRWLPESGWTHFGRGHGQATEALRVIGLDDWLTRKVVGIRDLAAGAGQLWVATARTVWRFDGTGFFPLPDDHVRGLSDLRYDQLAWAGGCLWATLRHRESRRIEGAVRWRPGAAAWTWLGLEPIRVVATEAIRLSVCGDRAWLTAPGWKGRALAAGPDDAAWQTIE